MGLARGKSGVDGRGMPDPEKDTGHNQSATGDGRQETGGAAVAELEAPASAEPTAGDLMDTETAQMSEVPSAAELAALMGRPELAPASAEPAAGEPAEEVPAAEEEVPPPAEPEKPADDFAAKLKSAEEARDAAIAETEKLRKEAEARVEKPEPKPLPVPPQADFFGLDAQVLAEVRTAQKVRDWVNDNPEGGEIIGEGNQPMVVSAAQAQAALAKSEATLAAARMAGKANFTQAERVAESYAREQYPNLSDPKHADHAAYERVMALMPELANFPDRKVWVGRMLRGYNAEQEAIKKAQAAAVETPAKETTVPKAPAVVATPRAQTTRTKPSGNKRQEFLADLKRRADSGDRAAALQYFAETT